MLKTYRFVVTFAQYVDVSATSKAKATAYFKKEYAHLLNKTLDYLTIWSV